MTRQLSAFLGAALALLGVSGCSLLADLDVKQCTKDADCKKYGARYADYTCEQEICTAYTCASDGECQSRGGEFAGYVCDDTAQTCRAPDCTTNAECMDESPTATCEKGRCVDDAWGCLGNNDTPASKPTLAFRALVQDLIKRETPADLKAVVCRRSAPDCSVPAAGPYAPDADGYVSFDLEDVPSTGFDGYVRFTAEGLLPLEFQFSAPLVRDFAADDTKPLIMVPEGTITTFGALVDMTFDEENAALMTMRLYDCKGERAAGLKLVADPAPEAIFYTADSTYAPTIPAQATDANGIGGLVNIPQGFPTIRVLHAATGTELFNFRVPAHPATTILAFVSAEDH